MPPRTVTSARRELAKVVSLEAERRNRGGAHGQVSSEPAAGELDLPWCDVGVVPASLAPEEHSLELSLELPPGSRPVASGRDGALDAVLSAAGPAIILEDEDDEDEAVTRAFLCNVVQLRTADAADAVSFTSVSVTTELPEALTAALRPHQLGPADPSLGDDAELRLSLINRARAEILDGQLEEADETLERAAALLPGDPLVLVHRAWVRLLSGEAFFAAWQAEQAVSCPCPDPVVTELADALAAEVAERIAF